MKRLVSIVSFLILSVSVVAAIGLFSKDSVNASDFSGISDPLVSGWISKTGAFIHDDTQSEKFRKTIRKNSETAEIPQEVFERYYGILGPQKMLDILEETPFCHEQAHNLGKLILRTEGSFDSAFSVCRDRCGFGCFHGILMEYVSDPHAIESDLELAEFANNLCLDLNENIEHISCYHSLGHAMLYLADYNISKGIEFCKLQQEPGNAFYCAMGLYMEYFMKHGAVGTYPCPLYDFPFACYHYVFSFQEKAINKLKEHRALCNSHLGIDKLACYNGIGHGYRNFILEKKITMDELCIGENEEKKSCIRGAVTYLSLFDRNITQELCWQLNNEYRDYCLFAITLRDDPLNRDFNTFYTRKHNS